MEVPPPLPAHLGLDVPADDVAAGTSLLLSAVLASGGEGTRADLIALLTRSGWTHLEAVTIARGVVHRLVAAGIVQDAGPALRLTTTGRQLAAAVVAHAGDVEAALAAAGPAPPPGTGAVWRPAPAPSPVTPTPAPSTPSAGPATTPGAQGSASAQASATGAAPVASAFEAATSQSLALVRATGAGPSGALPAGVLAVQRPVGLPVTVALVTAGSTRAALPDAGPPVMLTLAPPPADLHAHAIADLLGAPRPEAPRVELPPARAPVGDLDGPELQQLLQRADGVAQALHRAGVRPLPVVVDAAGAPVALLFALRGGTARVLVDLRTGTLTVPVPPTPGLLAGGATGAGQRPATAASTSAAPQVDGLSAALAGAAAVTPPRRRAVRRRRWPSGEGGEDGLWRLLFGSPMGAVLAEQGVEVVVVDDDGATVVLDGGPRRRDADPDEVVLAFLDDGEGSWPIW